VDKFWDSTKTALAAGLRELRIQSDAHLESLKQDAKKDYDPKLLQVSIDSLQSIQGLFEVENC
jgi:thiamine pyrophosphate-dependent acetolactate synthase large subunit-like protein